MGRRAIAVHGRMFTEAAWQFTVAGLQCASAANLVDNSDAAVEGRVLQFSSVAK